MALLSGRMDRDTSGTESTRDGRGPSRRRSVDDEPMLPAQNPGLELKGSLPSVISNVTRLAVWETEITKYRPYDHDTWSSECLPIVVPRIIQHRWEASENIFLIDGFIQILGSERTRKSTLYSNSSHWVMSYVNGRLEGTP